MKEKTKNNYFIGALGAIIGALIGTIPFVLMYVFFNVIYVILFILTVIGSFYGYKIAKATINMKLPVILSIISFILITIVIFLLIPCLYIVKSGIPVNMETFNYVFQYEDFKSIIITDYVISILWGIIVLIGISISLNKQLKEGIDQKEIRILAKDASNANYSKEDIEKVKKAFEGKNALDKNHTVTKELILEDLVLEFGSNKGNGIFNYLKIQQIIKKKNNKYYFCEKSQNSSWYRYGMSGTKTFIIVAIIAVILSIVIVFGDEESDKRSLNALYEPSRTLDNSYDLGIDNLIVDIPDDMVVLSEKEISDFLGVQYVNAYDCVSVSPDFKKAIYILSVDKANLEKDYTPEEYLDNALDNTGEEILEENIYGHLIYYVSQKYIDSNDMSEYVMTSGVIDAGDRFIYIILDGPNDDALDLNEIIVDNEKNDKNENNNTIINDE